MITSASLMTILFLAFMLPIIYIVGKENLKDFKELFEKKSKLKRKCIIIEFPERGVQNAEF